jgi:uncharacterized protein (TIGR03083 family)
MPCNLVDARVTATLPGMEYAARIDAVERELADLTAAVAAGEPDARVPTCPDFSLDDLAAHVGEFCGFWTHVLCEGTGRPKTPYSTSVVPGDRPAWLAALAGHLVAELRAARPDQAVWTWHPTDHTAAFVARRANHETAVHRVDAQLAASGTAGEVAPPELAADGIDEVLMLVTESAADPRTAGRRQSGARRGQTLALEAADHAVSGAPTAWLIHLDPAGTRAERADRADRGADPADLTLRGAVSDLEMTLYQRPARGPLERIGDPSVLDSFYAEFTFT